MKYTFALFTVLLLHTITQAQTFSVATLPITESGGKQTAQALVYLPVNYDAGKKYPLVIYAHGVREAGTDINTLYTTGLPKVLKSGYRAPFDFIMVAVQSPSYSVSPLWLPSILEWSQSKWDLDTNRIYLTGISAGGWASFGSQLNVSPRVAARFTAIAVHSGATQSLLTKNLSWWEQSKTPVWSVVGAADPNYVAQNEQLINSINASVPGLGHLTIRPAIGHGGWDDLYRGQVLNNGKNVWEWFAQFSRSNKLFPQPLPASSQIETTTMMASSTTEGTSSKTIKVNFFGGTNPYANAEWNNWNVSTSLSSGALKYSDATTSSISAALSKSSGINDNGAAYGAGMAPAEVLRYASNATTSRTLTINGLSSGKSYSLELYASRGNYSGNFTNFTVNGVVQSISTYNNLAKKAVFTALTPDAAGKITVTISNAQTYNYLNGFTLTESVSDLNGSSGPLPAFANHTISATSGTVNYGNGFPFSNLRPGDTINVLAGTYTTLIFGNFKGDPSLPIIIRNKGGQVKVGEIRILNDAKYFKLLGNGHSATQYGFKVYRTQYTGITVSKATDFEIGYCEVSGMTSGFFIKNNPVSTDPLTIYPNYVFKNIYLHHNYIHDVKNEAMYIGHTDPDGGQGGNMLIPVRMENVEIAYNVVNNTGWDGIQLANARTGNKVHHNTVTNFGTLNVSGQQAAIQIGSNSNVSIYDNTIKNGTGNGIQVFGYGYIEIYNNVLENCAKDGSLRGRETIYCNPYLTGPEVNPKQQVKIYNNTIRYPQPFGAIKVGGISTNSLPSTIINNKLLIPNAPSNWHSIHVVSVVPSSVISGNTLITQ